MLLQQLALDAVPPKVDGGVRAAILDTRSADARRWYVSVGTNYFLTTEAIAHRLCALGSANARYLDVYREYAQAWPEAESLEGFIEWCEKNRQVIESLHKCREQHALRFRRTLVGAAHCSKIGHALGFLFAPWTSLLAIAAILAAFTTWLSSGPPVSWTVTPLEILFVLAGIFIHEVGHISAATRFGAAPGGIGIGLYWIWPAFFADVRHSWSLPASQRVVVSASGVYFQAIYASALIVMSKTTGQVAYSHAIALSLVLMLGTLNPIFKFDGYWILSDLTRTSNLHRKIEMELIAMLFGAFNIPKLTAFSCFAIVFALGAAAYLAALVYTMAHLLACNLAEIVLSLSGGWTEFFGTSLTRATFDASGRLLGNTLYALAAGWGLYTMCSHSITHCASLLQKRT